MDSRCFELVADSCRSTKRGWYKNRPLIKKKDMNGELPEKFKTWNEFYASFKDKLASGTTKIYWKEFRPENNIEAEFTIEFIKSKCFDEIQEHYPRVSDWDGYEHTSVHWVVSKIDRLLCYKRPSQV
jgi:hypothetical protein